jgi:8-oxo-dGTP pyrophosphatase MutT (NUDIX family)
MDNRAGERVDNAVDAAQAALAVVRAMPGSQDRVDEAGRLARELRTIADEATSILREEAWRIKDEEKLSLAPLAKRLGVSKTRAHEFLKGYPEQEAEQEPSTVPEPQPVVAAIVSSHLGVLVARRHDGKPPWTFIAGEIEPGESPADAAVREVKEETGLEIRAGRIIGRRVHPATGRSMVYMAAWPVRGTDAIVGDNEELAEVRWASLAELRQLMGNGMYEPVQKHLRRTLEG